MNTRFLLSGLTLIFGLFCFGCGQKGPLYLPTNKPCTESIAQSTPALCTQKSNGS